jgi:hypothetical protein
MTIAANSFDEVVEDELHEIRKRRKKAGMWDDETDRRTTDDQLRESLTGVALSGGGVRSAAFGLGFLQGLYSAGKLRMVDYLSTVSGGGYAGALVSSEISGNTDGVSWGRNDDRNRLSIESASRPGQPRRIFRIALHGRRMGDVLKFLSRHLSGWMLTVIFLISGVTTAAALLAWLIRQTTTAQSFIFLKELGFDTDVKVGMFPAFLATLIWLLLLFVGAVCGAMGWKSPPTARTSYLLLLAAFGLGVVMILGMDDVSMVDLVAVGTVSENWQTAVNRVVSIVGSVLSTLFVLLIVPYLMPTKLLQSGMKKDSPLQHWIFNAAGYGVLIGAPLMIYFVLCSENISGSHEERIAKGELHPGNLHQGRELVQRLKSMPGAMNDGPSSSLEAKLWQALNSIDAIPGDPGSGKAVDLWLQLENERIADYERFTFVGRCTAYLTDLLLEPGEGDFTRRWKSHQRLSQLKTSLTRELTERSLSDVNLFDKEFPDIGLTDAEIAAVLRSAIRDDSSADQEAKIENVLRNHWLVRDERQRQELRDAVFELKSLKQQSTSMNIDELMGQTISLKERFREQLDVRIIAQFSGPLAFIFEAVATPPREFAEEIQRERFRQDVPKLLPVVGEENWLVEPGKNLSTLDQLLKEALKRELELSALDQLDHRNRQNVDTVEQYVVWLETESHEVSRLLSGIRRANWKLLAGRFPRYLHGEQFVFASDVSSGDQAFRLQIAGWSFLSFLIVGLFSNLNSSCLHGVYRDELAAIWLRDPSIRLKDLDTCRVGGPLHLINCTLNHLTALDDPDPEQRSRFILSHRFCGSKLTGYRPTELYQDGETTLADAVAISGAAVSTTNAGNLLYRIMLLLTNFRLGQWVRNPAHYDDEHYWPSPLRAMISLLWNPAERPYCFLSDGGHLDNTGIASLLERRCRLILLADASDDSDYSFEDLRRVMQSARGRYNLEFEPLGNLNTLSDSAESKVPSYHFESIIPDEKGISGQHFLAFRIRYPGPMQSSGLLIVCKTTVTGDEPIDVVEMKRTGNSFPHDPTANQFLPPHQFEAYVALGRHIGEKLIQFIEAAGFGDCSELFPTAWGGRPASAVSQSITVGPVTVELNIARQLLNEDTAFSAEHLQIAAGLLAAWLVDVPTAHDDDVVFVSSWVRSNANAFSEHSRRHFCRQLIDGVTKHYARINEVPVTREAFCQMLQTFGSSRIRGYTRAVSLLADGGQNTVVVPAALEL